MKKYDIAHSELTNCYYIMCDGKKVAECTEQIANIRADAIDECIKVFRNIPRHYYRDELLNELEQLKEQK